MLPIPNLKPADIAFGCIDHIPMLRDIPEEFKLWNEAHNQIIAHWFFKGLTDIQIAKLVPRKGVNKEKALTAIFAIMQSYQPKHEHKMAACSYLLSEWFDINHSNQNGELNVTN